MSVLVRSVVALFALVAAQAAAAEELQPGQWRVVTTTLSGPPAPPQVALRCLKPEEVKDLGKTFGPQVSTVNSLCDPTEFKFEGSSLSWGLQCKGQVDMSVAAQFLFESPTRYSALIVTRAMMLDRIVQEGMVTISAERVGDCP